MCPFSRPRAALAVADVLLALGFGAGSIAVVAHSHDVTPGLIALTAWISAPLAARRYRPIAVLGVITLGEAVYAALDMPGGPIYLAVLIAIYTVAVASPRRLARTLTAASVAIIYLGTFIGSGFSGLFSTIHLLFLGWAVAALFIAEASRNRFRYVQSLRDRARQAEETREEEARRRVAEERVRIARDLHDVVAHSLATITVQAAAGARVFETDPAGARDALTAIRETSKRALHDLGATLDELRPPGESLPLAPAPSLSDIAALLQAPQSAGIDVEMRIEGEPYRVEPSVDIAAYRILQESLTNIVRHAGASQAEVALRYAPEYVELEVTDNGRGPQPGPNGHGHGLLGMRERVENVGGKFEAGAKPGGGFRVWSRLPAGERA